MSQVRCILLLLLRVALCMYALLLSSALKLLMQPCTGWHTSASLAPSAFYN
jgi:hypothetical protein